MIRDRYPIANYHMYVVRLTRGGALATSKPCPRCMVYIKEARVESVTFIDEHGEIATEEL